MLGSSRLGQSARRKQETWVTFAPRTWLYLACLWLSIATALGHAVAPVGSPLTRTSGSAFSASTTDVALGPSRLGAATARPSLATDDNDGSAASGDAPLVGFQIAAPAIPPAAGLPFSPGPAAPVPSFPRSEGFDARAPPRG